MCVYTSVNLMYLSMCHEDYVWCTVCLSITCPLQVSPPPAPVRGGGGGGGESGARQFVCGPGDNPYAICARELGDGMKYLDLYYNGEKLTREAARNLPNNAVLVYYGAGGASGGGVAQRVSVVAHSTACARTASQPRQGDPRLSAVPRML